MPKQEVNVDLWVARQLDDNHIKYCAQGSDVLEIDEALKSASKNGTGNEGYPEYTAVIDDFVLVIEDKADTSKQAKYEYGVVSLDTASVKEYAVNGALWYAKHIAQNSPFKKIFAIGVSGDDRHRLITPLYVDDRESYKQLPDLETLVSFSPDNIVEYYMTNVLGVDTGIEKATEELLQDAARLHEYLRTYGTLKDQDKPLVVAGIMLALDEIDKGGFSIDSLKGDDIEGARDGDKILEAVRKRLKRSNVSPEAKRDTLLAEFSIIQTSFRLNTFNETLGKTPLKFYTEFLYEKIFKRIKYQESSEDFIGRFYSEFMSYSGGDGQTLGIILTPRHITDLMCELVEVKPADTILDPTCGTGGFLISAMHRMIHEANGETQIRNIKKKQLHGIELQSNMFATAVTNMILRDDGNANITCGDFLTEAPAKLQLKGATVGLMNPPYSQGTKDDPDQYEIAFVKHLLDSLVPGARCAVIVPQSAMTGKSKAERKIKAEILKHHTLNGVITCNTNTFYGVGTNPVIAVFTAHEPQDSEAEAVFIDFKDDGYIARQHIGLVAGKDVLDKKQRLLDVWQGLDEAPSAFCVKSTVQADDEWLHSFYYFNDELPTEQDFNNAIADYLTFQIDMIGHGRGYLFGFGDDDA